MKKTLGLACLVLILSLAVKVGVAQDVQKVTITATEYQLEPKAITVKPGKVEFQLVNKGKFRHNLAMMVKGKELKSEEASGGQTLTWAVDLPPGEYEIYCSRVDGEHKQRGMVGKLTVK